LRALERLFLLAGAGLFVWLVIHVGVTPTLDDLSQIGWGFVIVFAIQGLILALDTLGWRFTLPPGARTDSFSSLFAMRLSGDAINYLTPSASVGGEFVRYRLLSRSQPATTALSSVALMVINQFFSQVLFVLAGAPFVFLVAGHHALKWGNALASLAILLLVTLGGLLILGRRGDGLQRLHRLARKISWLRNSVGADDARWRTLDEQIFGAFRRRPADMLLSVSCFFLAWSLGIGECAFILYRLGEPIAWPVAFAIESLSVLVETALFFVPGKVGTQEGGKYFIFLTLGLDAGNGFSFGVIRRIRELGWALTGLLVFGWYQRRRSPDLASRQPSIVPFC
jgi:uncharacterized protein (TIRG00374 family)